MKRLGIYLPLSCLPSHYGIGDLGMYAYRFIDILHKYKVDVWHLAPLHCEELSFLDAIDPMYISLDVLVEMGYLRKSELRHFRSFYTSVDVDAVRMFKEAYYKLAYKRFKKGRKDDYEVWIKRYGLEYLQCQKNKLDELAYVCFLQYICRIQWEKLKVYAKKKNVQLMVDVQFQFFDDRNKRCIEEHFGRILQLYDIIFVKKCKKISEDMLLQEVMEVYGCSKDNILMVEQSYSKEVQKMLRMQTVGVFCFIKKQVLHINMYTLYYSSYQSVGSIAYQYENTVKKDHISLRRLFHTYGYKDRKFSHLVIRYMLESNVDFVVVALWDILGKKVEKESEGIIRCWKLKRFQEVVTAFELLSSWMA